MHDSTSAYPHVPRPGVPRPQVVRPGVGRLRDGLDRPVPTPTEENQP